MPNPATRSLVVRAEQIGDEAAITQVHLATFPTSAESQLVADLRRAGWLTISLVAVIDNQIVGHIAFSPVMIVPTAIEATAQRTTAPSSRCRGTHGRVGRARDQLHGDVHVGDLLRRLNRNVHVLCGPGDDGLYRRVL